MEKFYNSCIHNEICKPFMILFSIHFELAIFIGK